tara:strand:+ start:304 stop:432 length:129 start_codon:yes stop_codon:yes gene_type:complete
MKEWVVAAPIQHLYLLLLQVAVVAVTLPQTAWTVVLVVVVVR